MKNAREILAVSVLAAALAGCGGADEPEAAAEGGGAEEPTTTTTAEEEESTTTTVEDEGDDAPELPAASGDLDAVAEAVAATVGRADVGAAGASLGIFPDWLPAPGDAVVAEAEVKVGRPFASGSEGGVVLGSRVVVDYLTAEAPDALRPLYEEATAAQGWELAPSGWRTSEDDRARILQGEFKTGDGFDGPAIEVTVVAFSDEPDIRRVEVVYRVDLTPDEVDANPDLGDSLALLQDGVPVPDGFELVDGRMSINTFGPSVDLETSWIHNESLDHADLAGEIADAPKVGGWSVAGAAEATATSITTVPLARDGWERGSLEVSSSPDLSSTSVVIKAERPLASAAPAPAPAGPSGDEGVPA